MARLHRRFRKRRHRSSEGSKPRHNPPLLTDIGEFVIPGFVGFAATRFGTRIAATQIEQRKPSWGKHAGAIASVGSFFAAWLLAHRWKWLEKYHTPLVVGSAIAALQSLIQLYIPQIGWIVSDASPELAASQAQQLQVGGGTAALPAGMTVVDDDPNLYVYNDAYDAGRMSQPATGTAQAAPAQHQDDATDDLDVQDLGIFS